MNGKTNNESKPNVKESSAKETESTTYSRASAEINKWPAWKKEEYNRTFAVSTNARKIEVK